MNDYRTLIQFKEARARSINGAFHTFLETQIGISAGIRERASASQNALRDFLRGVAEKDETFPRILRYADGDFLGGSFARHTKIWPLDDVDVYFPIDATGLVYMRGGWPAPAVALTDDVLDKNPLKADRRRWWIGPHISSKKLIDGFADALRENYPLTTRVRRGGEAVVVTLANDLGFDVVPCFSLKPSSSNEQPFYLIPDGYDGWIHTNPRLDQELSDKLHRENHRTLRRGVKLFKWWAEKFVGGRVASYYAELAIMRAFQWHNQQGRVITTVSTAASVALRAVLDALRSGSQYPVLQGAPMVEPGDATADDIRTLEYDTQEAYAAFLFEQADQVEEALAAWRRVFGDEFPSN